jgi:V/A-type H+-transporting ATPase subunit I
MIVRMKEILLFTTTGSVDDTIDQLGQLGVVDIVKIETPVNKSSERLAIAVSQTELAISLLKARVNKEKKPSKYTKNIVNNPKELVERILETETIKEKCLNKLDELNLQLDWYKTWGEKVNIRDFKYLREKGIYLRLYLLNKDQVFQVNEEHNVIILDRDKDKIPVVLVSQSSSDRLQYKEEQLPDLPYSLVREHIADEQRQLVEIDHFLENQSENIKWLEDYHHFLADQLQIEMTSEGMIAIEGKIKYLKGYIPGNVIDDFKDIADKNHWGYHISEPEKPEDVPVYIKNPKWIGIINPVMKFIDIVPGYKEVDVSIYFLVAFALFFAMLVGDAGYGMIFLLLTLLFRKKLSTQMRVLIYVLSGGTIIWGVLSGTYFGSEHIVSHPFLNSLVISEISSFGVDNMSFMMHFSFLIGAIHLSIAHSIRVVQFINSVKALSEVGWIALVWGLFFITEQLVLGKAMPEWAIWLFVGGATLVALFSVESKNFFKSMLVSLANLPLSLISGFSDIVSYVRLFAVGMATAAVASSFNNMILPEGISDLGILELLMAAVALLLGHGLNIALALMAVMVHGIRLNMLEFAGHLGVQFSGEAYKPFKLLASREQFTVEDFRPMKDIN